MSTNWPPRLDYTNKDYASLLAAMLELAREKLPEWTDHSPNDLGVMLLELFAFMGDTLFYNQDRIAGESFLATAQERRSVLHLLRLIGYELHPPKPASADLTLLFAADAAGPVTIDEGATFTTAKDVGGKPISFRFRGPSVTIVRDGLELCRLVAPTKDENLLVPFTGSKPDGSTFRVYRERLRVTQVDAAVSNEIVGSSDGSPGQRFRLAKSPLIADSLVLTIDGAEKKWTRVDSLLNSQGQDEHYAVRRDEDDFAWIELGDNICGRVPPRGHNNIRARYLVGGGIKGNVPRFAIARIDTPIDKLARVINLQPASGGLEREATAAAAVRGPQMYRSMCRAVTKDDYETHARELGVGKVRALAAAWNRIDLVVAPVGGDYVSDTLERDILAYFESKRMMTTRIAIVPPIYVRLKIEGEIGVERRFSPDHVRKQAEDAVRALWSYDEVDFGDTLYLSKIYEVVERIEGLAWVNIACFARIDEPNAPVLPDDGRMKFGPREIPRLHSIELTLSEEPDAHG